MKSLVKYLSKFGARAADCVELNSQSDFRLLRYSDLIRGGRNPIVDVVIEEQTHALLYVVDALHLSESKSSLPNISNLQRKLAMRGDPAWLGVLYPGRMDIYATDLCPSQESKPKSYFAEHAESIGVLPRLAHGENLAPTTSILLRNILFGLMTDAGQELKNLGISTDETIALIGRALFFRYLIGRGIINADYLKLISPSASTLEKCFGSKVSLIETNTWLDKTFNGDLLKLPTKNYDQYFSCFFEKFGTSATRPLEAILGLDQPLAPGASQRPLNWGDLDFDHLPIGLLSETYEELMYHFDADARRDTSVYYTPSHIAEYMVEEAFYLKNEGSFSRVLDPACGAGVFLVASFRKLAELRFFETGMRPNRQVLREILSQQLVGFDINAHARTLTALALYLTALELDPDPTPVEALTFSKLEGVVLIDVADINSNPYEIRPMAGSLGDHVPDHYRAAFDVVIGNPPWTSLKPAYENIDAIFTQRCREIAGRRGLKEIASSYKNPDNVTDLPFMWGAMDWAKPGGRIALALAGRWLFKMSPSGFLARSSIFKALAITGILNGASIRQSKVWPNVDQPFCLVFAENKLPKDEDQFLLVSPEDEPELSEKGRMRIDASDAVPISLDLASRFPSIIKTLYRGLALDMNIIRRIQERGKCTIGDYWKSEQGLFHGQGYQVASRSRDDTFLSGLPTINAKYSQHSFVVFDKSLPLYQPEGLQWPRQPIIYKAPLILIRKGSRANRDRGRALISTADLAYSESYYGFSAAKNNNGDFLTRYLLVLLHSQLFEYFTLMTSGEFGLEREALQVRDIENFPFVAPETLSKDILNAIETIVNSLMNEKPDWGMLDNVVSKIYGLGTLDIQVINDTLATRSPFPVAKKLSAKSVNSKDILAFCNQLQKELNNILSSSGYTVNVGEASSGNNVPWKFIAVSLNQQGLPKIPPLNWIEYADSLAVSRITILDNKDSLIVIGLLNRYRYWTKTQARLLASDILWQYGATLEARAK